jgi:hypothetical protein
LIIEDDPVAVQSKRAGSRLPPLKGLNGTLRLALQKRIHFLRGRIGQTVELDGEVWTIFREVVVDPLPGQPARPGAIFRPRFHLKGMSVRANIVFSWIPVWFILGLPGFRSKLWLVNKQGDFSGYYEWDSLEDAENYAHSFATVFMKRRSIPGSVKFQAIALSPEGRAGQEKGVEPFFKA